MTQEAATTAELLTAAKEALETYHEVHVDDDGAQERRRQGAGLKVPGWRRKESQQEEHLQPT